MAIIQGQDLHLGNRCSKLAFGYAQKTFKIRRHREGEIILDQNASFSNVMRFGSARIGITSDGIGTKIELAERCQKYDSLGYDLIAMVADDLIASGIEPAGITNILDVDKLDERVVDELMQGLHNAAIAARMTICGGEIAELGSRIGGFGKGMHFNWCATAYGHLPEGRDPLSGKSIATGDQILAIFSPGLRSNGFSLARSILHNSYGENWHERTYGQQSWGEILLTPCLIYAPALFDLLNTGMEIHSLAHITGGGLPDNLGRLLRINEMGALLDDLFQPEEFLLELQRLGKISDHHLYHTWNMNHGMLAILPPSEAEKAGRYLASQGLVTKIVGCIMPDPGITIISKGLEKAILTYDGKGK